MTIRSSVISCDLADRMPNFTVVSKRELGQMDQIWAWS